MDFKYDEEADKVHITAYREFDICAKCFPQIRKRCPLLNCISCNYVYPCAESLEMTSCNLYDFLQKVKSLKDKKDEDTEEPS